MYVYEEQVSRRPHHITLESSPEQTSVTKVIFQTQDPDPNSMELASYVDIYKTQPGLLTWLFKSTLCVLGYDFTKVTFLVAVMVLRIGHRQRVKMVSIQENHRIWSLG